MITFTMGIKYVDIVTGAFLSSIYVANIVLKYLSIRAFMVSGKVKIERRGVSFNRFGPHLF